MDENSIHRWESIRSLGFWRFTLIHGVMAYGMSMTVALHLAFEWIPVTIPPDPLRATKFTILGIVAGFVFGLNVLDGDAAEIQARGRKTHGRVTRRFRGGSSPHQGESVPPAA